MTKQEYEAKVLSLKGTHDYNMLCFIRGEYIASLEAEIAQLKKNKLEFNAQCFHKDETISVLKNRITELKEIIDRIYDVSMKKDHEFGLTYQYANDIIKQKAEIDMLKQENANLKDEIAQLQADNRSLVEQMNQMDNPQIGNPSVIGFYGVNTVDPIPELLEWDGDRWLYPYPPTMEYPANDVISWVLVSAYEECKFHKGVNND